MPSTIGRAQPGFSGGARCGPARHVAPSRRAARAGTASSWNTRLCATSAAGWGPASSGLVATLMIAPRRAGSSCACTYTAHALHIHCTHTESMDTSQRLHRQHEAVHVHVCMQCEVQYACSGVRLRGCICTCMCMASTKPEEEATIAAMAPCRADCAMSVSAPAAGWPAGEAESLCTSRHAAGSIASSSRRSTGPKRPLSWPLSSLLEPPGPPGPAVSACFCTGSSLAPSRRACTRTASRA